MNVLILGAAGKDFFVFQRLFKGKKAFKVKAFTAAQIQGIAGRRFPAKLAGKNYPAGIPIFEEKKLGRLIKELKIGLCVFAYSDASLRHVAGLAEKCSKSGAGFMLPEAGRLMLESRKKVIAVTAVRTGAGKSPLTRRIIGLLKKAGKKVVVLRHPMPYGKLEKQIIERFVSMKDLERHECTIEEREEFEPLIAKGIIVYAGVDYERILKQAEKEADIIIWDGGNNDIPFIKPDLWLCVADPLRQGDELSYYPGIINFLSADVIVINKVNSAKPASVKKLIWNTKNFNPKAAIIKAESIIKAEESRRLKGMKVSEGRQSIKGKKVLVVEDGPSLTHGGMAFGAGYVFAEREKAVVVDAGKHAVGSIKKVFRNFKQIKKVLPAMGYSRKQLKDLQATINKAKADFIVNASPINLPSLIKLNKPCIQVSYELKEKGNALEKLLKKKGFM
ncbi:GTPase [archaeon]|nr:GTPase [archaeon]